MIVTATANARHLCTYRDGVDTGTVTLTFEVDDASGDAPELCAVAAQIFNLESRKISHEDFTRLILEATRASRVVSRWTTAGLDVECDLWG